jgi:hypothetical protein
MSTLLKLALTPYCIPYQKIRLGRSSDGGYIVFNHNLENITHALSYGISGDVSFDLDFTKYSKSFVYMFDHTIDSLPVSHPQFIFIKEPGSLSTCIKHITDINVNKSNKLLLKMDIEGHEWEIFKNLPLELLSVFEQIVIEFHNLEFLQNQYFDFINMSQNDMADVFNRINTLFYLGHIHGNNCGGMKDVPNTIECTYIRKDLLQSPPSIETISYPILNLDFSNSTSTEDYTLDWWLHNNI